MGYEQRSNAAAGFPRVLADRLAGLRVVVDVQHVFRSGPKAADRGAEFKTAAGLKTTEAAAALQYAAALCGWLRDRGANVLTNEPTRGILVGPYSVRNSAANAFNADLYLACHVNAGGGAYFAGEYMVGTAGQLAAGAIGRAVLEQFPEVQGQRAVPLVQGQRGAVCIQGVQRSRVALILEPFFGDNARQRGMLEAAALKRLGEAIGAGVAAWWETAKPKK